MEVIKLQQTSPTQFTILANVHIETALDKERINDLIYDKLKNNGKKFRYSWHKVGYNGDDLVKNYVTLIVGYEKL